MFPFHMWARLLPVVFRQFTQQFTSATSSVAMMGQSYNQRLMQDSIPQVLRKWATILKSSRHYSLNYKSNKVLGQTLLQNCWRQGSGINLHNLFNLLVASLIKAFVLPYILFSCSASQFLIPIISKLFQSSFSKSSIAWVTTVTAEHNSLSTLNDIIFICSPSIFNLPKSFILSNSRHFSYEFPSPKNSLGTSITCVASRTSVAHSMTCCRRCSLFLLSSFKSECIIVKTATSARLNVAHGVIAFLISCGKLNGLVNIRIVRMIKEIINMMYLHMQPLYHSHMGININ